MKSKFLLIIALAAIGLTLRAQPLNWRESSPANFVPMTIAPDFDNFSEGSKSVKITFTETGTPYYVCDTFNIVSGSTYSFSIDVLDNDAGGEVNTRLVFVKANGTSTNVTSTTFSANSPTWQTLTMTGTAPADAVRAYVVIRIYDVVASWTGSATFNLDKAIYNQAGGTTNLIVNPGFETWVPPVIATGALPLKWRESSPANFVPMTVIPELTNVSHGFVSAKITFTETGTPYYVCDTFNVTSGAAYNFSINVFDNDPGGEVNTRLVFINAAGIGTNVTSTVFSANSPAWQTLTMTGTAPADAVKAYLVMRIYDVVASWTGSATFYLDNAKYMQGTSNLIANPSFENWSSPSTTPAFITYKFAGLTPNVVGIINNTAHTVALTVPYPTNVTALVATFTLSDNTTAKVGAVAQVSGVTPNNFTNPVTYTLTKGALIQDWIVTVTKTPPTTGKDIITFKFEGLNPVVTGIVTASTKTVTLEVPTGTNVTALVPTITVSPNAVISPASGVPQNYTTPKTYTVTAQDGSTAAWVVTVTVVPPGQTTIFYEPFDELPGKLPSDWIVINNDGYIQASGEERWQDSAWLVSTSSRPEVAGTKLAVSSSFCSNMPLTGRADDWMILPTIGLLNNSTLSWQAMSLTSSGNYPDDYKIYIAPAVTGATRNVQYFEENGNLLISVAPESWSAAVGNPGAGLSSRSINLKEKITPDAPNGWFNRPVWIAFVLTTDRYTNPTTGVPNATAGGSELAVDNIKVYNNSLVGLADYKPGTFDVSIYPNPAKGEVNLNYNLMKSGMANISIADITGRVVFTLNSNAVLGPNRLKLDVSSLPRGVYLLRTLVNNDLNVTKLMIQ